MAWRDLISFAILNLAGLIHAPATGLWRPRQIYDAAYFPLAGTTFLRVADNTLLPQEPLWTTPTRLQPKWTDGLRFQRLMDVNAAYDEAANAFWLQARKAGPSRGEHAASILGIIESSKDREYRLQ